MKTLYLTNSSCNIAVDFETNEVTYIEPEDRYAIRSIYYIEEPMHVVFQAGEHKEEIDAKKGDILLVFYTERKNKYILSTIRSKQWVANIKYARKLEQEAKEEWAKRQAMGTDGSCDKCDEPC